MNNKIFNYLLLIPFIIGIYLSLPSEDIMSKTENYLERFNISNLTNYFLYDENYIGSNPHIYPLNILYEKQLELYDNYTLRNYIFFVEKVNEKEESIEDAADNIAKIIENLYNISLSKSIMALFSISTHRMRIRTGKDMRYIITDYEANQIIKDITPYLKNESYYEACELLIEKIDYFYNHSLSDDTNTIAIIFLIIAGSGFILAMIFFGISKKCVLPRDEYLIEIVDFLFNLRKDKTIFDKYCVICCNKLSSENKEKELTPLNDSTSNHVPLIDPGKEIKTLDCQHQFHNRCLNRWMMLNKECPICLYNDDNEEYGKKVWNIQLQLHPSFNKIKYKHLYTWSFAQPSSGNNGDFDFGGDI